MGLLIGITLICRSIWGELTSFMILSIPSMNIVYILGILLYPSIKFHYFQCISYCLLDLFLSTLNFLFLWWMGFFLNTFSYCALPCLYKLCRSCIQHPCLILFNSNNLWTFYVNLTNLFPIVFLLTYIDFQHSSLLSFIFISSNVKL